MRSLILTLWNLVDPLYYRFTRLSYVGDQNKSSGHNIFRVRVTRYKGRPVTLSDGTKINKNDPLVKIHLHNAKLLIELRNEKSELKKAKMIYRRVKESLPGVEQYIRFHQKSENIKGIIGITSLNRGCQRLGFEIYDISNPLYKKIKHISFQPICILSRSKSVYRKQTLPSYLFMSKEKLSKMYG